MGLVAQAITVVEHAVSIPKNLHVSHWFLGKALAKQGRFEEAIAAFEASLFYHPDFYPAGPSWSI
jgi:hypothetical protein